MPTPDQTVDTIDTYDRARSYIHKVNKVSVTVLDDWGNGGEYFTRTIPFDKLAAVLTRDEVEAARADGRLVELPADPTGKRQGFVLRTPEPAEEGACTG